MFIPKKSNPIKNKIPAALDKQKFKAQENCTGFNADTTNIRTYD